MHGLFSLEGSGFEGLGGKTLPKLSWSAPLGNGPWCFSWDYIIESLDWSAMSVYSLGWNKYFCYSLTVYVTVLMIVKAASPEVTPSLSRSAMSPVLALSIADQPLLKLSRGKDPYLCYRILKIKNVIWEIKRDKVWNSKNSWKIKMKH